MWETWEAFHTGYRRLSDAEIKSMLEEVRAALPYLKKNRERFALACMEAMRNEERLTNIQRQQRKSLFLARVYSADEMMRILTTSQKIAMNFAKI